MSKLFQELDYRPTPIGELTLRRRKDLSTGEDIYEIKLGQDFLMASNFTASEIALAQLGLAPLKGENLDVLVGGLGLGYTAQEVLRNKTVGALVVVEALDAVIDWHEKHLLPIGPVLTADPRCRFIHGDFFKLAADPNGFDKTEPGRRFDAIIVDIDHSPSALLDPGNASFYEEEGLERLKASLKPGGVFALWSNDRPDAKFVKRLQSVFASARAEEVTFANHLQNDDFTQTVYLASESQI